MTYPELYSGVVINQNGLQEQPSDVLSFPSFPGTYPAPTLHPFILTFLEIGGSTAYYQTFALPADFSRDQFIPPLTGFQIFVIIDNAATAIVNWSLDRLSAPGEWTTLASGTKVGTGQQGELWMTVFFEKSVIISPQRLDDNYRIHLSSPRPNGLDGLGYTVPNPIPPFALFSDGGGSVLDHGRPVSMLFRLLAGVADGGVDFLGNVYRSLAVQSDPNNVDTGSDGGYWLSNPNPSQFAVESLYFDERQQGNASVIDRFTIDPITPGVYFHLYYSNDPTGPGIDTPSWEKLLWTPVYKTFQTTRQTTYVLPEPIAARYLKVEFSGLQARSYDPGSFQKVMTYEKFPKWVLDYFIARFAEQEHDFISSGVDITYDLLDLAYNYYAGDILTAPDPPSLLQSPGIDQSQFFADQNSANQVDPTTLAQVKTNFQPYQLHPALQADPNTTLGAVARFAAVSNAAIDTTNYPVEDYNPAIGDTTVVSNLSRDPLILERGFPVMFFFLPSRHSYRVVQSNFQNGVAYFVGLNSIAFHRDEYVHPVDAVQYNEILADGRNAVYDDFVVPR